MGTVGDSAYKTDLSSALEDYLLKHNAAVAAASMHGDSATTAEATYQEAKTAYELIVSTAATGGPAPTAAELATYQGVKKNRDAALVDKNAADENLAILEAQIAKLNAAVSAAAQHDIDPTLADGPNGEISSSTYRLKLFQPNDTLSFNVKYKRTIGVPPGAGFTSALEQDHTFTIRLNMIASPNIEGLDEFQAAISAEGTLPQVTSTELYGVNIDDE